MTPKAVIGCLTLIAALGGSFSVHAAGPPASAEKLRTAVETALHANDTNALVALVNWQGVSDNMKSMVIPMLAALAKQPIVSVKLVPLGEDYQSTNEVNGVRYRPNVALAGQVQLEFAEKNNFMKIPYGKTEAGFYLNGTVGEKIPGAVIKSKALGIMIMGVGAQRGTYSGTCVYVQGSLAHQVKITEAGNSFIGDYIKSCTVQKITDDSNSIQMTVLEDGKTVFESDEVTNRTAIVYEKE